MRLWARMVVGYTCQGGNIYSAHIRLYVVYFSYPAIYFGHAIKYTIELKIAMLKFLHSAFGAE